MSVIDEYISVTMTREHLEDIPQFHLPPGFTVRWYQDGDEELWLEIERASEDHIEITHELFVEWHGDHLPVLKDRMFFLLDSEMNTIGTATAWFLNEYNGKPYGRVGWVAIIPEMRSRGLSRPMMTVLCNRLKDLGHKRAYLTTSTARFPAIRLYWQFGFRPEYEEVDDRMVWQELERLIQQEYRVPREDTD
jgi:GNAT superfamily N-acetyltransferase